jgi:hypothetical protein
MTLLVGVTRSCRHPRILGAGDFVVHDQVVSAGPELVFDKLYVGLTARTGIWFAELFAEHFPEDHPYVGGVHAETAATEPTRTAGGVGHLRTNTARSVAHAGAQWS